VGRFQIESKDTGVGVENGSEWESDVDEEMIGASVGTIDW